MKRLWFGLTSLITTVVLLAPAHAFAASTMDIVITELQVRSSVAADQEFVELYNTTDQPVNVSRYKLQYKSATGTTWTDKITLHGNLNAHSYYLLVSDTYPTPPTAQNGESLGLDTFAAGLSDSAGHVRIVHTNEGVENVPIVHDTVGWGSTANAAEGGHPASAPGSGKVLQRLTNQDGTYQDTDDNAADFALGTTPSPTADVLYVAPEPDPEPVPEPTPDPEPTPTQDPEPTPTETPDIVEETPAPLAPPVITELLPNPAAPATDSVDEYIELYNPNNQPLDLTGYKLQAGSSFSYSYTFETGQLTAYEYKAFYVTETGDILSNTAGQARLINPTGATVSQTDAYTTADDGDAWAFVSGAWQWTTTPTPNAENILTTPVLKLAAAKTTTKKAATPKTPAKTTAKVASAKTTKPSSQKTAAEREVYQDPAEVPPQIHPGILAGVGVMTLLYALYEYRLDAINRLHQFRRYRELRRANRA